MTGGLSGGKKLLRAQRSTVLRLARHLIFLDQIFRVPARVLVGKCVIQTVAQHAVVKLADEIRRLIHILHATGCRNVDIAEQNVLCG
jgi:hypothetical protein